MVHMCLGAINREATDDMPEPDALGTDHFTAPHWGFVGGPHRCLGSHLARMELKLVLERWHERIPDYGLAPGAEPKVVWPASTNALDAVPLVWALTAWLAQINGDLVNGDLGIISAGGSVV